MSDGIDQVSFSCVECGSVEFVFPNQPPNDDDIISCAGCKREIGRYDVIRLALINAGKAEIDEIATKIFGKKPDWK